jgi:hypothetical protein
MVSTRFDRYYGRLRRPPGTRPLPGSPPVIGQGLLRRSPQPAGPGRASPVPAVTFCTFHALYAGEFLTAAFQGLHRFHGLRPEGRGSALPCSHLAVGTFTARQASRDAADRAVAPPNGACDAALRRRAFPPTPAACYRAPWRLPGPDSHRLATTSFGSGHDRLAITSISLGALPRSVELRWRP